MLRALDQIAPAKIAIPLGVVTAGGLVVVGLSQPTLALIAGIALLGGALLLSLSARWRLAGNPDPVTAGVHFETPDQPAARWIGLACVILGGAVLGYGAWDTVQTQLTTAWDPMRGALAVNAAQATTAAPVPPAPEVVEPASKPLLSASTRNAQNPSDGPDPKVRAAQTPAAVGPRERPAARVTGTPVTRPDPTKADVREGKRALTGAAAVRNALAGTDDPVATPGKVDRTSELLGKIGDINGGQTPVFEGGLGHRGPGQSTAEPAKADYKDLMKEARKNILYGQNSKAVQVLNRARKIRPSDAKPLELLCTAQEKLGNRAAALKACKEALLKAPNNRRPVYQKRIQRLQNR